MKKLCVSLILAAFVLQSARGAVDLKQSRLTQVINSVEIISSDTRHTAEVNDVFKMPDVMRTGAGARAEMIADDGTLTRVGANTIFSFDPAERTINLDQGSLLFHAPHGKGGGTIRTGSATASVLGTTIIVTSTPNGGFKVLDLEGEAEIRFLNGLHERLTPGQMVFILPGGGSSPIVVFRLDVETGGSLLVNGFKDPLPSWPQIQAEITRQLTLLLDDLFVDTDLVVGDNATPQTVQVVMNMQGRTPNASVIGSDHTPDQPLPINYPALDQHFVKGNAFVGQNVDIDTADINLGQFATDSEFDFHALNNLRIWQSLNFTGNEEAANYSYGVPDTIALIAGNTMEIAPDSTLTASTGTFDLIAGSFATLDTVNGSVAEGGDDTLEGVGVENYRGNVNITSLSDLTWDDGGYVYADGGVDIGSAGSLTLGNGGTEILTEGDDFEAYAYGTITLTAVRNLTLDNAYVDSYDSDVDLTSIAGNIVLEYYSEIDAGEDYGVDGNVITGGGNVNITAENGNVDIYDSSIYAYADDGSSGNVYIYANGAGDVEDTYMDAYGNVNIESVGSLTLGSEGSDEIDADGSISLVSDNSNVYVDYDLYAGGDVDITSGQSVSTSGNDTVENGIDIEDSDIYAGYSDYSDYGGNVNINAYNGGVTINDSDLYAYADGYIGEGSMYINADDGGVSMDDNDFYAAQNVSITSSGSEYEGGIDIYDSDIYAGYEDSIGGNISLASGTGEIYLYDSDLYAYAEGNSSDGNININAYNGNEVYIDDAGIYAAQDVSIMSCGSGSEGGIDIEDVYIEAGYDDSVGGNVNIDAYNGDVTIDGSTDIYAYSGEDNDGNISIYATGTGDVEDTYMDANGNVNIESQDSLTLGYNDSDEIDAGGSISLVSDYSNVYVDYDLDAGGDVDITSGQSIEPSEESSVENGIDIEDSDIYAGDSDSIAGNVNINAYNGGVTINYSDIYAYANGNSGEGSMYINADDGGVSMYDDELYAAGDVSITSSGTDNAGGIDIEDSDIYAGYEDSIGGNINLDSGNGEVYLYNNGIYAYADGNSDEGNININAYDGNEVGIYDTDLYAAQNVSIMSCGTESDNGIDIEDSDIYAGYEDSIGGNITLNSSTGEIYLSDNGFYAYAQGNTSDGNIYINANNGDEVYIDDSDLYANQNVSITSSGTESDNGIDIEDTDIYAGYDDSVGGTIGGNITLDSSTGENYLDDSDLYAYAQGNTSAGNIYINAYDGNEVYIDDSGLYANQNVSIMSCGTESDNGIDIYDSDIYAGYEDSIGGNISLASGTGEIYLYDSDLYAYAEGNSSDGNININAYNGNEVYIDDAGIYAAQDVSIMSCGSGSEGGIDIEDVYIEAGYDDSVGGNVNIDAYNGDVTIDGSTDIYAYSGEDNDGNISIYATGTGDVEDTYMDANGNVNIESQDSLTLGYNDSDEIDAGGSISLVSDYSNVYVDYDLDAGGDVDITSGQSIEPSEESSVENGIDIEDSDIYAGDSDSIAGNVNINAYNGGVTINYSDIYAYANGNSGEGSMYINADDGGVSMYDDELYAAGDVSITSSGTDNAGGIDIEDSDIYAGYEDSIGGNINLDSGNGEVYLYNNGIYAYADGNSDEGNININAEDGDVYINSDNDIYAAGNVSIMSCGTDNGTGVSIYDSYIDAGYDDSIGGNVTINAYNGDAYLSDDSITAYEDSSVTGEINITAEGNIDVLNSMLCAPNGVSLTANNGYVNVYDSFDSSDLTMNGWSIWAGTEVDISADNIVSISDSTIEANGGDVNINSGGEISPSRIVGNDADIGNYSYIQAVDSVNVTANSGTINITGNSALYAEDGDVTLTASGGGGLSTIYIDASTIEANGNVSMTADSDITITDNSLISASSGNTLDEESPLSYDTVSISSGGTLTVDGNGGDNYLTGSDTTTGYDIGADTTVYLYGDSGISLDDAWISTLDGSSADEISLYSYGMICINDGSSLYSGGSVWIESYDGNVGINSSDITANDGQVYVKSDNGTLMINEDHDFAALDEISAPSWDIAAYGGDVELYGDSVSISDAAIYADDGVTVDGNYGSVTITDADIETDYGNIDMYAYNSSLGSGDGNLTLNSGSADYGVNLSASGSVSLGADNNVTIDDTSIYTTGSGNITIYSGDSLSTGDGNSLDDGVWIEAENGGSISMTGVNDVDIYDSYISADHGDVDIASYYNLTLQAGNYYGSVLGNNVTVTAYNNLSIGGEVITANNGDVTITAGAGGDEPVEYIPTSYSTYSPAYIGFTQSDITPANTYSGSLDISTSDSVATVTGAGTSDEYLGNITFEGGTGVAISDQGYIAESGDIDLTADTGDIDITGDSTSAQSTIIQALGGSVNLTADSGAVNVTDGYLEADSGNVNITATGDVTLSDSTINASEDVSIASSGGTLSINEGRTSFSGSFSDGVDIYAGTTMSLSGVNVTIQQAALYSQNELDITGTDGNVTIEDADMASDYGNVDLDAVNGSLTLQEGPESQGVYIEADDSVILNGDNGVSISDSTIYSDYGDIQITSNGTVGGVSISDSYIEAFGNLTINSDGNITLTDDDSADNGELYSDNGNITIQSTGGTVEMGSDDIEANGDVSITTIGTASGTVSKALEAFAPDSILIGGSTITSDYGSVTLNSAGDTFLIESDATGFDVDIGSQGTTGLQESQVVAYNDISLSSALSDVDISDSLIVADGSQLQINAPNGTVNISDAPILPTIAEVPEGTILAVDYYQSGEPEALISITSGTDVSASGNVYVTSNGGEIAINAENVNISDTGFYFGGGITINDSTLTAQNGNVDITSEGDLSINVTGTEYFSDDTIHGGAITIDNASDITADAGDVNIDNDITSSLGFTSSESDISISDSIITANADTATGLIGGQVNIITPGNVNVIGTTLSGNASVATPADYDVNITAGGYVNVLDSFSSSSLTASAWDVTAGTYVDIAGDDNLTISGDTITANGGDVNLRSGTAVVITAVAPISYDLTIENGTSIQASGSIIATANDGDNDIYGSTLTALNGNVQMDASQNVDVENNIIQAYSSIIAQANGGNNDIFDDTLTASHGNVQLGASQNVTADNTTFTVSEPEIAYGPGTTLGNSLEAPSIDISSATGGNIEIDAGGNVTLSDDTFNLGPDINISGSTLTADTGNVTIDAGLFTVTAGGTVGISGCLFNDGNINISTGSTITATAGDVYIEAGDSITIGNSTISATPGGSDTDLSASTDSSSSITIDTVNPLDRTDGNIYITAQEGDVTSTGSTFNLGGSINISDGETVSATAGDVDITAGQLTISAPNGTIDMSSYTINGGDINITGDLGAEPSVVSASGSVNLIAQDVTIMDSSVTAGDVVNITAAGSVDIASTSSIDTSVGNSTGNAVKISAQDGIAISGANVSANTTSGTITLNNTSGETTVNGGSQLQAFYINVNSDGGILIDGSSGGKLSGNTVNVNDSLGTVADDSDNGHTVTIQNSDLSSAQIVNVQGHTVNLNGDNFSSASDYNFTSFYHGYYVNNGNVAGYVNFNGDTLDHTAITVTGGATDGTVNPANNGGIGLGGTGAGIHVN